MKKLFSIICFVFALGQVSAQKLSLDSLTRVATSQNSNFKTLVIPNRDSLLNQFSSIKSPALRIKLIYDIITNYGELKAGVVFYYHRKYLKRPGKTMTGFANQ
jgi:hypothetical protein